jgi:23S rRNA (cytidine1920-2'-O)/16S rRNA (cytidine1409-2'-O)-methyltransferase
MAASKNPKERVDVLLAERGLAPSRERAQALVIAGLVRVGDQRIDKPGTRISLESDLRVVGDDNPYASRGGLKLAAALDAFHLQVDGCTALDVGASTGGFTDCLLQRGASKVFAVDVGYGQLAHSLRIDSRVVVLERVNARELSAREVPEPIDFLTVDVSFISLRLVLPACVERLKSGGVGVLLVKPQFEVGKGNVGKGGVVRDPQQRAEAIAGIEAFCRERGLAVQGIVDSPIAGPAGNVEALLVFQKP